jgi:hypothetical protein
MLQPGEQYSIFKARPSSERHRLDQLLSSQERRIREAFITFVRNARSPAVLAPIKRMLKDNNIQGATSIVDQHVEALGRVLPQAFVDVASNELPHIASKAGFMTKAAKPVFQGALSIGFDPSDPRAANLMQAAQLNFVQNVSDSQRAAIRASMSNAYGTGDYTYAQSFIDSIGLTPDQVAAVDKYQSLLEAGSSDALARDLRNRRYDQTVTSAFDNGEPLDSNQIDTMVNAYRDNMLNYRADTIARTEGLTVMSQARLEAMNQVLDQSGIDRGDVTRTWSTTLDGRERSSHYEMNGQQVGIDVPYVAPSGEEIQYPGDPDASAGERINCRCTETMDFA